MGIWGFGPPLIPGVSGYSQQQFYQKKCHIFDAASPFFLPPCTFCLTMSSKHDDPENQAGSDEQTPLLGERRESGAEHETEQTPLLDGQASIHDEHEQAALLEPPPWKRTRSWWFWRILWTIVAALILAVFIKGWIDADDTHVSKWNELIPMAND